MHLLLRTYYLDKRAFINRSVNRMHLANAYRAFQHESIGESYSLRYVAIG